MADKYTGSLVWLLHMGNKGLRTNLLPLKYSLFGIQSKHIPDLIRMALDEELAQDADKPQAYAGIHAWRALGELQAAEAVEPLTSLLKYADEPYHSDWILEDLPRALGKIGPAAIPVLWYYGNNPLNGLWARTAAIQGLVHVAENYPEQREEIIRRVQEGLAKAENEEMVAPWDDALISLGVAQDQPDRGFAALINPLRWAAAENASSAEQSAAEPRGKKHRRRKSKRPGV